MTKMGRPKSATAKTEAVMVRLDPVQGARFKRLVAARQDETKGQGLSMSGPDVIRWLIARECAARGIEDEDAPPTTSPAKPAPKPKKAKQPT